MLKFRAVVCSACRAYGVPLLDNLCVVCYTLKNPKRKFEPGQLPKNMFDLFEGVERDDIRRSIKYRSETDQE